MSACSFALSSDKTELFSIAVGSFLDRIMDSYNRQWMPRLWAANGQPPELMPKLTHSDVETPSIAEISALITSMVGAGAQMFPDRELENSLRARAQLPLAPEEGLEDQGAPTDPEAEMRRKLMEARAGLTDPAADDGEE